MDLFCSLHVVTGALHAISAQPCALQRVQKRSGKRGAKFGQVAFYKWKSARVAVGHLAMWQLKFYVKQHKTVHVVQTNLTVDVQQWALY